MKKYYAIFPGPDGLETKYLGELDNFDCADAADKADELKSEREPTTWIADDQDMKMLYSSIRKTMKFDA